MPQTCTVCAHRKTKEIEDLIVQGKANTQIAGQFGLDHQSVRYHKMNHLPKKLIRSIQKKDEQHAENILGGINDLLQRNRRILDEAEDKGQKNLALKAIKEARTTYELLSKIAVKLQEFQQHKQKRQDFYAKEHIEKGLNALTDKELQLHIQLVAKIHAADPNYMMDNDIRMFVEGVEQIFPVRGEREEREDYRAGKFDASDSISPHNRPDEHKNTQNSGSNDSIDFIDDLDFDLEDLSLDDENTIPSEETDSDWLS